MDPRLIDRERLAIREDDSALDHVLQVANGCGQNSYIHPNRYSPANPLDLAFLEHSEEGDLGLGGKFADFIEQESAPISGFESADAPLRRTGERALLVPEQFRGNEGMRVQFPILLSIGRGSQSRGSPVAASGFIGRVDWRSVLMLR